MTEEKQIIEEMAKVIASVPPIEFPIGSRMQGKHIYTATKIAEHLYNADYRKQSEGEWIRYPHGSGIYCSLCKHKRRYRDINDAFCPNCGAKMKGGE